MVAGGDDGLLLWRVGPQWLQPSYNHCWHDVSQPYSGPCNVLAFTDATGAKIMLILPTLWHHPLRALCFSVEKNTDSLVMGMILFDQGGGGRGEKVMVERAPPPPSMVCMFVVVVCAEYFF